MSSHRFVAYLFLFVSVFTCNDLKRIYWISAPINILRSRKLGGITWNLYAFSGLRFFSSLRACAYTHTHNTHTQTHIHTQTHTTIFVSVHLWVCLAETDHWFYILFILFYICLNKIVIYLTILLNMHKYIFNISDKLNNLATVFVHENLPSFMQLYIIFSNLCLFSKKIDTLCVFKALNIFT